jgi:small-conductance mechanosensitive channel
MFRQQGIDMPYPRRDIRIQGLDDAEGTSPKPPAGKEQKSQ